MKRLKAPKRKENWEDRAKKRKENRPQIKGNWEIYWRNCQKITIKCSSVLWAWENTRFQLIEVSHEFSGSSMHFELYKRQGERQNKKWQERERGWEKTKEDVKKRIWNMWWKETGKTMRGRAVSQECISAYSGFVFVAHQCVQIKSSGRSRTNSSTKVK